MYFWSNKCSLEQKKRLKNRTDPKRAASSHRPSWAAPHSEGSWRWGLWWRLSSLSACPRPPAERFWPGWAGSQPCCADSGRYPALTEPRPSVSASGSQSYSAPAAPALSSAEEHTQAAKIEQVLYTENTPLKIALIRVTFCYYQCWAVTSSETKISVIILQLLSIKQLSYFWCFDSADL